MISTLNISAGDSLDSVISSNAAVKFGRYGGLFVPETLVQPLKELSDSYLRLMKDDGFRDELGLLLRNFAGRPTALYHAKNLSHKLGRKVYLKREDLVHGGAHKLNNTLGQALVAKKMGKTRLIAETGAGQHGVATAIVGANLGFQTQIYMGEVDIERQKMNVYRMRLMGAEVIPVRSGSRTLKDAINEAMRDWAASFDHTHYLLGTAAGAHPFPSMVRDFQSVIGRETRDQILEAEGRLPDSIVACVGGGSNAMGIFAPFLADEAVRLIHDGDTVATGGFVGIGFAGVDTGKKGRFVGLASAVMAAFGGNDRQRICSTRSGHDVRFYELAKMDRLDEFGVHVLGDGKILNAEFCRFYRDKTIVPGRARA